MSLKTQLQQDVNDHWSLNILRAAVILWALAIIALAFFVNNKWILAGIFAWEVLP